MGFSLLSMKRVSRKRNEPSETINHPLCGYTTEIIPQNHLSNKIELSKLLLKRGDGDDLRKCKDVAVIKQGVDGLEMKWYATESDIVIPVEWLSNLLNQAKERLRRP